MAIDRNAVVKEAQKFAAKGQFDKAIVEWKKIAKETPNDANLFNTIGDLCLKKNSKPEAVEAYKKAADILAGDGFTSKAIALYKKVLNIDPKKIEAHLALADLNAEKGLTGNALESYKIVADHYTHNKEKAKALGIFQKMADLNASNAAFRLKLADMYAKEGMKKEAVLAYLQAADVHVSKEAFTDARQLFEKALALDPNNKEVYHKAGLVYFKEGKFVEACKALKPAFENDPANTELTDLYLDALAKAGRGAEAADVYQKLLEKEPDRAELREKLYRLYLFQKEYDKAFAEVSTLANSKIENKDLEAAEQILNEFLAEAPASVDGMRALSALYNTVGKGQEAADQLVQAAHILIDNGDRDGAKEVLARALEIAPGHAEAMKRLDSLEPRTAPAKSAAQQAEPAPAPEEAAYQPAEWTPPSAPEPEQPAEDPAVTAALNEIDVLVKYGLATKAVEQLEGLAKKYPGSIQTRIKLRDVYGDMGNMGKAVVHMIVLADLYSDQGRQDEADQLLQAAQEMDPGNALLQARMKAAGPAAAAPLEEPAAQETNLEEILPPFDHAAEVQPAEEAGFLPAAGIEEEAPGEISFDQPFAAPDFSEDLPAAFPEEVAVPEPVIERPRQQAAKVQQKPAPAPEIDLNEVWAEAEFYYQQGLFEEARKHYETIVQHNPDNAKARERIAEISREQEEVQEFSRLADAVDELEGLETPGPAAASREMVSSSSDEEAVRSLMQEIAQLNKKPVPPSAAPAPPKAPAFSAPPRDAKPAVPAAAPSFPPASEDFFDLGAELNDVAGGSSSFDRPSASAPAASDDFFDLASELRDELSSTSIPAAAPSSAEDQSLDDIFEEFKKGVEQQAVKEDVDTHYNLGVAYKEMGLLDDAIGEFVMTPEDEPKYVQSRYMLGLCYMEKGDYDNAIREIQNAMTCAEEFGVSAEDHQGMCYDLGLAYQGSGDAAGALQEFMKVYAANPGFRDVSVKVKGLQQGGGGFSMDQLKQDIEQEISSKFLQEGERIQREEKTKKDEKVRR